MSSARPWRVRAALTAAVAVLLGMSAVAVIADASGASTEDPGPGAAPTYSAAAGDVADVTRSLAGHGTMLVIGDSYSSYYGDLTTRYPGWWAHVGAQLGLRADLLAVGGTGFLARRLECDGESYDERLAGAVAQDPTVLVIEGGRNDWNRCVDGRAVESTRAEITAAVDDFFDRLSATWAQAGRRPGDIYVLSPWGEARSHKARVIRPIVREAARAHGFTWITTTRLTRAEAPDGTHPNNAGSRVLADEVLTNSDLADRFGTTRPTP